MNRLLRCARITPAVLVLFCVTAALSPAQKKETVTAIAGPDDTLRVYNDNVNENCASRFAIRVDVAGGVIRVTERDTVKDKMRCMCTYALRAQVAGLAPGSYRVEVYREYLAQYGYAADTTMFIGAADVEWTQPAGSPIATTFWQGPCRIDFREYIDAVVRGDTVTITDYKASENCASRFAIELTLNGMQMVMIQRDTVKMKALCTCEYDFTASMTGLAPGTYRCDVRREYRKEFGYYKDTVAEIGYVYFTIAAPGGAPAFLSAEQSECTMNGIKPPLALHFTARIHPQPLRGDGRLLIGADAAGTGAAGTVSVEIHDLAGRLITRIAQVAAEGRETVIPLPAALFASTGTYLCTVSIDGERATLPFLVVR
jgi:uncharacterized membrane protein